MEKHVIKFIACVRTWGVSVDITRARNVISAKNRGQWLIKTEYIPKNTCHVFHSS